MTAGHKSTQAATSFLLTAGQQRRGRLLHAAAAHSLRAGNTSTRIRLRTHFRVPGETVGYKNMKPLLTCTWSAIFLHFMHLSLPRLWVWRATTAPPLADRGRTPHSFQPADKQEARWSLEVLLPSDARVLLEYFHFILLVLFTPLIRMEIQATSLFSCLDCKYRIQWACKKLLIHQGHRRKGLKVPCWVSKDLCFSASQTLTFELWSVNIMFGIITYGNKPSQHQCTVITWTSHVRRWQQGPIQGFLCL